MISKAIILLLLAYFLGSVPWGVIITRLFGHSDVREAGSGNIGAYNVYRVAGIKLGIMTLVGDFLKGAVAVLVAIHWVEVAGWKGEVLLCLVALAAFAGHLFPVFLDFKGGKGGSHSCRLSAHHITPRFFDMRAGLRTCPVHFGIFFSRLPGCGGCAARRYLVFHEFCDLDRLCRGHGISHICSPC